MNDGLDFLLEPPAPPADSYRWATVTQVTPEVRIRFDGEPDAVPSAPSKLTTVAVGNRVWVQIHGRSMIILGKSS